MGRRKQREDDKLRVLRQADQKGIRLPLVSGTWRGVRAVIYGDEDSEDERERDMKRQGPETRSETRRRQWKFYRAMGGDDMQKHPRRSEWSSDEEAEEEEGERKERKKEGEEQRPDDEEEDTGPIRPEEKRFEVDFGKLPPEKREVSSSVPGPRLFALGGASLKLCCSVSSGGAIEAQLFCGDATCKERLGRRCLLGGQPFLPWQTADLPATEHRLSLQAYLVAACIIFPSSCMFASQPSKCIKGKPLSSSPCLWLEELHVGAYYLRLVQLLPSPPLLRSSARLPGCQWRLHVSVSALPSSLPSSAQFISSQQTAPSILAEAVANQEKILLTRAARLRGLRPNLKVAEKEKKNREQVTALHQETEKCREKAKDAERRLERLRGERNVRFLTCFEHCRHAVNFFFRELTYLSVEALRWEASSRSSSKRQGDKKERQHHELDPLLPSGGGSAFLELEFDSNSVVGVEEEAFSW